MINLLEETADVILKNNLNILDITFIGSSDGQYRCTWDEFCILANRKYYNGFGSPEVATDLIILFKGGERLFREEYDGAENWQLLRPVVPQESPKKISGLFGYHGTIADIDEEQIDD